jgi:fermentation-respiration switch protein FrsA (DUF1100 family)
MPSIVRGSVISKVVVLLSLLISLVALLAALVWIFQERIAFQPPRGPWPSPAGGTRVEYEASDGQKLFAYLVGDPSTSPGLLLSFHGNADLAAWQISWAEELSLRTGVAVLLAEYRGYMGLEGRPSYSGSEHDAEAAYAFSRNVLRVPADRIAMFGHSLGSAIATELAVKHQPAALILQSPFTSAREMAGRMTGHRPAAFLWRLISRLHFDTGVTVASVQAPVFVAHGGRDRLIPPEMGRAVYDASPRKGEWLLVPDAAHNDVGSRGGEAYWSWMKTALASVTE